MKKDLSDSQTSESSTSSVSSQADGEKHTNSSEQDAANTAHDLGVPKFLVNKWLNVQNPKSKFVKKSCQIDNAADVSEYSVIRHNNP